MKRIAQCLTVSCLAVAATSGAYALDLEGEMYVVGSVGNLSISQPAGGNSLSGASFTSASGETTAVTNLQSKRDTSRIGYKLQLGYEFSPHFAVEGGYIDLGKTTDSATYDTTVSGTTTLQIFNIPIGKITYSQPGDSGSLNRVKNISGWNIAGVGTYPIDENFSLFAKIGLIDAKVKYSSSGSGPFYTATSAGDTTESNWKGYYGIGATYYADKSHDFGVRLEHERFSKIGDINGSGSTDVNLTSLGILSKF